jgi:hypothetical protein
MECLLLLFYFHTFCSHKFTLLVFSVIYCYLRVIKDAEVYEHVRKLVENSLRSGFLPARIAGLHGVLYLLQAAPARTTTQHVQMSGGSVSDEVYHIQPVAIEYIQKHIDIGSG